MASDQQLSGKEQMESLSADLTIIGAGPGGYVAAIYAAKLGAKVALVEKESLGGACLNWGCIPTKSLARSAEVLRTLQHSYEYGCIADNVRVDLKQVKARKDRIVSQLIKGITYLLQKNGVTVIEGEGSFLDRDTVVVKTESGQTVVASKHVIIATGSQPAALSVPGVASHRVLGSRQVLDLDELPSSLVIVGGGVIGMEFAFIYNSFGVDVTVVEYLDSILPGLDKDVVREINRSAKQRGIRIYTGARVETIADGTDGECHLTVRQGTDLMEITASRTVLAVGRRPYLDGLGVEKIGVELNSSGRGIKVDEHMATSVPNVYAIGDVTDRVQLAHVASHQGMVAVRNIMGDSTAMDYAAIPSAIFTDPEIAVVGVTEAMAQNQGRAVEVGRFPLAASGKALASGDTRGFVKIIKDKASGRVVGGAIVGLHATDLIAELTLAVQANLTPQQLAETIHAHPTAAEGIYEAALSLEGGAIHSLR